MWHCHTTFASMYQISAWNSKSNSILCFFAIFRRNSVTSSSYWISVTERKERDFAIFYHVDVRFICRSIIRRFRWGMSTVTPTVERNLHEMLRDAPMMNDSTSAVHSGFTNPQLPKSIKTFRSYWFFVLHRFSSCNLIRIFYQQLIKKKKALRLRPKVTIRWSFRLQR